MYFSRTEMSLYMLFVLARYQIVIDTAVLFKVKHVIWSDKEGF